MKTVTRIKIVIETFYPQNVFRACFGRPRPRSNWIWRTDLEPAHAKGRPGLRTNNKGYSNLSRLLGQLQVLQGWIRIKDDKKGSLINIRSLA